MLKRALPVLATILLISTAAQAATFIVPGDREFMHGAKIIVIASALTSYTRLNSGGSVETVTTFSIEDVIKGRVDKSQTVDVVEPGGVFEDHVTTIPGIPRFDDGGRYVLFILPTDGGWHVLDLTLGKFAFATDTYGRKLLVRDEEDIVGWDPNGRRHAEPRRDAAGFLKFLRTEAGGGIGAIDYYVPRAPVKPGKGAQSFAPVKPENDSPGVLSGPLGVFSAAITGTSSTGSLQQAPTIAPYTATSYTFTLDTYGGRWNVFPNAVTYYSSGTEAGAAGGGTTAINAALSAWTNDPGSNVNLVYGGADPTGTHNGGTRTPDGQNTIAFERDLSYAGAGLFQCTSNSYSGTLGLGGITNASGTHTGPNGETFYTAVEGDVEMNKGIANCSLLLSSGDFNSGVTHEVGHTLGFRHSDQTRADNPSVPCSSDPSLECSTTSIMKSFVAQGLNAALQAYDQHAVQALYPGTGGGGTTTPPKSTVVFTDEPLVARVTVIQAVHLAELRTAVNQIRSAAGLGAYPFTDSATSGLVVKALHIQQLRTALDEARGKLGLSTGGWTDPNLGPGTVIKAVHFQEIRNKTKCGC